MTLLPRHLALLLLAGLALVAVPAASAGAADVPCQRTFSSGRLDKPIPDNGSTSADIDVPEDGLVVTDVDVTLDIHHPFAGDLLVVLTSFTDGGAARGIAKVFGSVEDGGADVLGAVLDDEAAQPLSWGLPPFTGRFKPLKPLAVLDGAVGGRYRLDVADTTGAFTGVLDDWSVTVTYASCDLDADGVEDHVDQCRGLTARTASGCPLTSRAIRASYRGGKFRGALSSPVAGCEAGRPVSVFRVRPGTDGRVGTTRTRADGSWRLARAKRAGRYYATSPRAVVPDLAECPAARSRTFRVG